MRKTILSALLITTLVAPVLAGTSYPISGRWGQSNSSEKGAIDCGGLRTVEFKGERRFDSGGSIRDFRAVSVSPRGASFSVREEFRTGQVNGRNTITLRQLDPEHLELAMQFGGTLKLRRCK